MVTVLSPARVSIFRFKKGVDMTCQVQISQRRNIAVCGHGSSGKTSLLDTLLQKQVQSPVHTVLMMAPVCVTLIRKRNYTNTPSKPKYSTASTIRRILHFLIPPAIRTVSGKRLVRRRPLIALQLSFDAHAGIEVATRDASLEQSWNSACLVVLSSADWMEMQLTFKRWLALSVKRSARTVFS